MEVAQVEFLWKAMTVIPQNNESTHVLKCHFMSKCRSLHGKGDVHLPAKHTRKSSMCQFCSNIWKNGKYSSKIVPEKNPPKSIKKILARYSKNPNNLRKFEIGLAKKYAQKKNTLVITCGVCHRETKIDMIKPERKTSDVEELPTKEPQLIVKRKKKKWVKDRTAGLKIPAVWQTQAKSINDSKKKNLDLDDEPVPPKSEFCVWKKNDKTNSKETIISGGAGMTNVTSNKRKKQLKDSHSTLESCKKKSRLKIERKPEIPTKDKLMKLVKNNKLGSILANAGKKSESPLSKFLSSL